ncbi:MAG: lamin tail domain-containing protein [Nocardioidaceae bacterium]
MTGAALAVAAVMLSAPATMAAPHGVVVSEVYGGGGNSGATWTNDFVELYNTGSSAVSLDGWSVQYASASGTSYQVTRLSGSIAPGAHYLVGEAAGSGGTTILPAADAEGTIAMNGSRGKVALVRGNDALTCGPSCHAADGVEDFVGYDANDFETAPAPATSNTTSVSRDATGSDTDDNAADFTVGGPSPTNAAGETSGGAAVVSGLQIHDVQGASQLSPYAGRTVLDVPGVVTAVSRSGFWMQSTTPDDDPATSEGVYVFTGSRPAVAVSAGDAVTVSGKVSEYRAGSTGLTVTELDRPSVTVGSSGNELPPATLVGPDGRVPPASVIEDDADGDVEHQRSFDPGEDGIDFWESMEGMRVAIDSAQVVGPTNKYGETPVVPVGSGLRTARGGVLATATDYNPERVILGDTLADLPSANTGDTLAGTTVGVLDYAFGNFMLEPTTTPTVLPGGTTREVTRDDHGSELSIASFNVENLSPADPAAKFDGLAHQIVHNLAAPDIVGLEEVQDDNGPTDDGTVDAGETLRLLTAAIVRAGGPSYQWRQIDPVNDAEGGQPGGNIRVAFLFRPGAGLSFVDRGTPASTEGTAVVGTGESTHLTRSPGRIDPANPAWEDSRVPLVGEFTWRGEPLFLIGNHFASKGGDDPLFGRWQPPLRSSEAKRHQQAQAVRSFVDDLLAADPSARVAVLGDLNDFEFSTTADILVGSGATTLTDLPRTLPAPERYTYVYEGNSQVLDHILLSPGLVAQRYAYDVVHVNAEFADQLSDHDPQVVRLGRSTVRR